MSAVPMRATASPIRDVLVICALLVTTNGPVLYVEQRVVFHSWSWEGPFVRPVFVATALAAVAAVLLDPLRLHGRRLMRPGPVAGVAILAFSTWAVLSSVWSLDPAVTRGRAVVYVGLAALAWLIADLDFERQRRALGLMLSVAIGASLVAVILSDSIGLDRNDDWRGIYTNRNSLAPLCGLAIVVGIGWTIDRRGGRRFVAMVFTAVAAVTMLGSGSRTAWLALFLAMSIATIVCAAGMGLHRFGKRAPGIIGAVAVGGAALVAVVLHRLWGESTFVQRRTIWDLVWDRITERPLHGYGWWNVWQNPDFISGHELLGRGSAHNSFLEVWLGLGLVGLIPFVVVVILAVSGTSRDAWRAPSVAGWTWLSIVAFLVIENLTESFVLWFSYNWVLLMAAALRFGVSSRDRAEPRTIEPSAAASG